MRCTRHPLVKFIANQFSRLSIPALALAKVLKPIKEVMIEDMVQSQLRPQPASNGTDHEKQIQS